MTTFGIYIPPDAEFGELAARWRLAEDLGFDGVYVPDHSRDYRGPGPWFDGWTMLAALAVATTRVRIGPLVSNPILRGPTLLAREAMAVDHLSGGRLELAIGSGVAGFDHAAQGTEYWSPAERAARLREYVTIVDELLSTGSERPYRFAGTYYSTEGAVLLPAPVQRPRPPITVGGSMPTVRAVAAERADCWNTHGPYGRSAAEILEITRRHNAEIDERCAARGRDPKSVRRSLLLYDVLDPWHGGDPLERTLEAFSDAGFGEFVLSWPYLPDAERLLEKAADVLPAFR